MRAVSGFSRLPDTAAAAREALATSGARDPHTIWVFASHHHARSLDRIPFDCWAATGYGALSQAGESEEEPGLALLALQDPSLRLSFASMDELNGSENDWGRQLAPGPETQAAWLFLGPHGWPETVAGALGDGAPGALVCGAGLSGSWDEPTVLLEGRVRPALAWRASLSGARQVEWTLAQAAAPLGEPLSVTRLVGDRLLSLEGRPASVAARERLGGEAYDRFRRGALPVYVRAPHKRADRLFRVDGVDERNQALLIPGLPEDCPRLSLARVDAEGARLEFAAQLAELRSRCPEPAFAVYVNCCARGQDLYGRLNVDAELFREAFPGVPMLGVSGSFELAPRSGGARLCSYTGVLVVVG